MDTKKNLKPELKEIYERVMNTQASARTAPAQQTPSKPSAQTPQPSTTEEKKTETPASSADHQNPAEPFLTSTSPRAINNTGGFVFSNHGKTMPKQEKNKEKEETKEEHIQQPKSTAKTEKTHSESTTTESKKQNSNLLPTLLVLMVIFVGVYTLFWAFFLGII